MARNTAVHVLDDLNGEPAEETVSFALDGVEYDIDLSAENAANLRGILDAYVGNGRRTGGRKRRPRTFAVPKRGRRAGAKGAKTPAAPKKTAKASGGAAKATAKTAAKKVSPKTAATAKAAAAKVKPAKASAKAAPKTSAKAAPKAAAKSAPKTAAKSAVEKKTATARKPAAAKAAAPAKPKRSPRKAPPVLFSAAE